MNEDMREQKEASSDAADKLARIVRDLPKVRDEARRLNEQAEKMEAQGRELLLMVEGQLSGRRSES